MFSSFSMWFLVPLFVAGAIAVWQAGDRLSDSTDVLAKRFKLGGALGGLLLLAIATNLPEIAITVSAAMTNQLGLAIGNILGGVAIQTVVLVVLDVFGVGKNGPLSYRVQSLVPVIEGIIVIAVLIVAIMGTQVPKDMVFLRITPDALAIVGLWLVGLWLAGKAKRDLPWRVTTPKPSEPNVRQEEKEPSTGQALLIFGVAAVVTLIGGVVLEQSGDAIASQTGLSGVLFGSTLLAAATAIPEVSTGLASVRLGDYELATGDIFGGNAFLPVLFLVATLVSGQAVLPQAQHSDIYLAGLGILLTAVYMIGFLFGSKRRVLGMGLDSLVVLIFYLLAQAGLIAIAFTQ